MYCPSRVGVKNPLHVISGNMKSGINVVAICKTKSSMAVRSKPRRRNKIPMRHSTTPSTIKNAGKLMKEMVCSNRACTRSLAGERPKTFRAPNQKNTTNKARRAKGISIFLKKLVIRNDMFIL